MLMTGSYPTCESNVVRALTDLLAKRLTYAKYDGERFLDAEQNARLVANAERYYRIMYYGSRASWNLRDSHMFETLKNLLAFHGADGKAVVWAHNSHVGNAAATEMAARVEQETSTQTENTLRRMREVLQRLSASKWIGRSIRFRQRR